MGSFHNARGAWVSQALRWDGARWSMVPVPSPGGTAMSDVSELLGVACASPRSCWAVGTYLNASGVYSSQALRWNGARWSVASVPSFGRGSELSGVRCTSPAYCWAVGPYINPNGARVNQVQHWDGRGWSFGSVGDPGGTSPGAFSALWGVACTSSADCWAVGVYFNGLANVNQAVHWDGTEWNLAPTPDPGGPGSGAQNALTGVACSSSADCWAVGFFGAGGGASAVVNQVVHWNGTRWSVFASPDPGGFGPEALNVLQGVACTSSADCWAVGVYGDLNIHRILNQALHWNGRGWSLAATPDPGGYGPDAKSTLNGVACTSAAYCWAVGQSNPRGQPARNQALHWNGSRWSVG